MDELNSRLESKTIEIVQTEQWENKLEKKIKSLRIYETE